MLWAGWRCHGPQARPRQDPGRQACSAHPPAHLPARPPARPASLLSPSAVCHLPSAVCLPAGRAASPPARPPARPANLPSAGCLPACLPACLGEHAPTPNGPPESRAKRATSLCLSERSRALRPRSLPFRRGRIARRVGPDADLYIQISILKWIDISSGITAFLLGTILPYTVMQSLMATLAALQVDWKAQRAS